MNIVRSLAIESAVQLMDEPFASPDAQIRESSALEMRAR